MHLFSYQLDLRRGNTAEVVVVNSDAVAKAILPPTHVVQRAVVPKAMVNGIARGLNLRRW
jgi:hypothetical protein